MSINFNTLHTALAVIKFICYFFVTNFTVRCFIIQNLILGGTKNVQNCKKKRPLSGLQLI